MVLSVLFGGSTIDCFLPSLSTLESTSEGRNLCSAFKRLQLLVFQTVMEYDLTDNIQFFANAKYVFTETTESNQVNGFNDDIPISLDNPYIPAALSAQISQLQSEGVPVNLVVSRDVLDTTARSNPVAERKMFRIVTGFEGFIPQLGLDYSISYNYGRTDADITSRVRLEDRYFAAIDAVVDPATGEVVCRSDLDPTAVPPTSPFPAANSNFGFNTFNAGDGQCVPISIFGPNSISQEGADFIYTKIGITNQSKKTFSG